MATAKGAAKSKGVQPGPEGSLLVHKNLYSKEVLFGTAFTFLDRCYVHLDVADPDRIRVQLRPRPNSPWTAEDLAGEFANELVNQALRFHFSKQTEKVRSQIITRAIALAGAGDLAPSQAQVPGASVPDLPPEVAKLLAEEDEILDFLDDPLGIAVPWEEKYGKEGKAPNAPTPEPEKPESR
ncbi:His-Xaa-Ser system protein HxsD [Myxococcota bacterium]|jgi:His-Xaa-Ser system protein HxsD|nr:His-Xaa-Ser system protein HxsD [Myxococcota bacterium]